MNILITGSSGFIGSKLLDSLHDYNVYSMGRKETKHNSVIQFFKFEINQYEDYSIALDTIDVVIHLAARAHVMNDKVKNPIEVYREVNTRGTRNLAQQAARAGVKRFIFISSIKVNGEESPNNQAFSFSDIPDPKDFYGLSKAEAEQELYKIGQESGMETVIIRPALVYGPGVKGNFSSLMKLVSLGIPLPFGCMTHNKRSLVSVYNLIDLIVKCIDNPKAANQIFLASDDHDVSTSDLARELSLALGKSTWQLPVSIWCYRLMGKIFNKSASIDRLVGSLNVDISHTKETLDWVPPYTLREGLKRTADYFLYSKKNGK